MWDYEAAGAYGANMRLLGEADALPFFVAKSGDFWG